MCGSLEMIAIWVGLVSWVLEITGVVEFGCAVFLEEIKIWPQKDNTEI